MHRAAGLGGARLGFELATNARLGFELATNAAIDLVVRPVEHSRTSSSASTLDAPAADSCAGGNANTESDYELR